MKKSILSLNVGRIVIGQPFRPTTRMQLMAMFLYPDRFKEAMRTETTMDFYRRLTEDQRRYVKECVVELLAAKDNRLE